MQSLEEYKHKSISMVLKLFYYVCPLFLLGRVFLYFHKRDVKDLQMSFALLATLLLVFWALHANRKKQFYLASRLIVVGVLVPSIVFHLLNTGKIHQTISILSLFVNILFVILLLSFVDFDRGSKKWEVFAILLYWLGLFSIFDFQHKKMELFQERTFYVLLLSPTFAIIVFNRILTHFTKRFVGLIQELEEKAEILKLAKEEALEANRSKSRFLANMGHEIRTPLNAILGYTGLIEDELQCSGNSLHQKDFSKIKNAGKQLLELVDEVLRLSKMEAHEETVHYQPCEINELMNEMDELMVPLVLVNNNQWSFSSLPSDLVFVSDRAKIRQCLINLVGNATKFTHNGNVELSVFWDDSTCELKWIVRDTGIGIPTQHLENIFQSFWQVESSDHRKYEGTGLGLTITKKLWDLLGGTIEVQSVEKEGSTFVLTLPLFETKEGYTSMAPPQELPAPAVHPKQ